jgi:hypothetical protein
LPGSGELAADIASYTPVLTPERQRWLNRLAQDPAPLLAHLALRKQRRLGLYFEALWHFFLAEDPAIDFLAHNLTVRDESRTVGEFDCLYYCREQQRHFHLELAVKFYLCYRGSWLGPNARDRLDLKLARLEQHQLRLADHPAAAAALERLGIFAPGRQAALRGRLFTPVQQPDQAAAAGCHGGSFSWLPLNRLATYLHRERGDRKEQGINERYALLGRNLWFSPVAVGDTDGEPGPAAVLARVQEHFSRASRPLLVAILDQTGQERSRFFVTPDDWPESV